MQAKMACSNWPPTLWLRWVDRNERLIPTEAEQLDAERRQREAVLAKLRTRGIDLDKL